MPLTHAFGVLEPARGAVEVVVHAVVALISLVIGVRPGLLDDGGLVPADGAELLVVAVGVPRQATVVTLRRKQMS